MLVIGRRASTGGEAVRERLHAWLLRLMPWYDPIEADRREVDAAATLERADVALRRTDRVLRARAAYRAMQSRMTR